MKYFLKNNTITFLALQCSLQSFFDQYILSKKYQHLLIQEKRVLVDGIYGKRESFINNKLEIIFKEENIEAKEIDIDIQIYYEDEFCLVAYKPYGLLVHDDGNDSLNLKDILISKYHQELYPIHRLDKETQGLVFFCKHIEFQALFDKMLFDKKIKREYLAYVEGNLKENNTFTVKTNISKDRYNSKKMIVAEKGKQAISEFTCLKNQDNKSLVSVNLKTGRTHQIRVHCAYINHPIIGDSLYGDGKGEMALYAYKLSFYHPFLEKKIEIDCLDKIKSLGLL